MATGTNYLVPAAKNLLGGKIRVPFYIYGHGCGFDFVSVGKKFAGIKIPYLCPQTRLTCGPAAQVYKGLSRVCVCCSRLVTCACWTIFIWLVLLLLRCWTIVVNCYLWTCVVVHWNCDLYRSVIVNCEFVIWLAGTGVPAGDGCGFNFVPVTGCGSGCGTGFASRVRVCKPSTRG